MEETSHFQNEESDDRRAREIHPYFVVTGRIFKVDNERLMMAQDK
jgi:hypothetical protein